MSAVPTYIEFTPSDNDAAMDYDADIDCVSMSSTEHDDFLLHDFNIQVEQEHDIIMNTAPVGQEKVVSHEDLDAMKRMIHEMRQNPELLNQSPVYSKTVLSCNYGGNPGQLGGRAYISKSQQVQSSLDLSYRSAKSHQAPAAFVSSSTMDVSDRTNGNLLANKDMPITPPTHKVPLSYVCQECSSPNGVSGIGYGGSSRDSINFMPVSRSPPPKPSVQKLNVMKLIATAPPLPFR